MAESDKNQHISESIMEHFSVRNLSESGLTNVARHVTQCADCQMEFVSTLRRQRGVDDLSFTLAPEFWLRHEHLDYEHLVEFAESKLDATDRELIDAHLELCPPCQEDVRSFLAFREQIAPEMRVSHGPVEKEPAKERLTSINRWRGLAWKPVYSAALVVIGVALVIGAALLLNRRTENQQAQQEPTPQVSPSSTRDVAANLPSPTVSPGESVIEKPNSSEAIVVLHDRGATITVDKSGNVVGLEDVPNDMRQEIAQVLLSERLDPPTILKDLRGHGATLRGSANTQPFKLTYPSRTVIVSDRPTFKWGSVSGANSYRVYVNDPTGNEIAKSEELPSERSEWKSPKPLKRGEIYVWTVVAIVNGKEIVSPGVSAPEMKFQILSRNGLQQLNQIKKTRSHLALGVFYSRSGMTAEAVREFQILVRNNPGSPQANKLLGQAQSWTRR